MSAFWALSTCRQMGFSPGPIPWNHVHAYAEFAGLDRENGFAFSEVMRAMDNAWLDYQAEEQSKAEKMRSGMAAKRDDKPN